MHNWSKFSGSIIRAIRREEELLRQLMAAAKAIGNTELEIKFSQGLRLRALVFLHFKYAQPHLVTNLVTSRAHVNSAVFSLIPPI